jgi:hypothetical protein
MVRSSGVMESIEQRGTLESVECNCNDIAEKIIQLKQTISEKNICTGRVHWIVQAFVHPSAKGHLSNERRLCKETRDWIAAIEPPSGQVSETHPIAIRKWRDARTVEPNILACEYRANVVNELEQVASWSLDRQLRILFEWVWDGKTIYIVQADECRLSKGVIPKNLVQAPKRFQNTAETNLFRLAESRDFQTYRKLSNASCYQKLNYKIVDFFVLDDQKAIAELIKNEQCSKLLFADLMLLTSNPLVIRMDGVNIPDEKHQMLPRSDELRTPEAARCWLIDTFAAKIKELGLDKCNICLIAHHFVPATASAWCQAYPDKRRVRIESLWGIPEGLYWYAHDVFDVDTLTNIIVLDQLPQENFPVKERLRYKGQFIAPNDSGEWVLHQAADNSAWQRSIHLKSWITEIAWTSRRIAVAENKPVVVMWLIDIPKCISSHTVMPWYHEKWENKGSMPKAAPRKKLSSSAEFTIRTESDWTRLKDMCKQSAAIVRVLVDPREPVLFRDQQFAKELATLANEKNIVVELSGGILSHVYYLLASSGCKVECADLYAIEDEELEFNKLVRDKIPENIIARGENVECLKLEGEALIAALKRKVIEEAFEVADSKTSQQLVEEFADL